MTDAEMKDEAIRLAGRLGPGSLDDLDGANPVLLMVGVSLLIFPGLDVDWATVRHFMAIADEKVAADVASKD